ncbi:unnamed protein product, partial [Polarella glacialis]
ATSGPAVSGSLFKENGLQDGGGAFKSSRWLRATPLPLNSFVERELCAEFQLLESLCDALARPAAASGGGCLDEAARRALRGSVQVLISSACCMSCICAFRQFQLLWPGV